MSAVRSRREGVCPPATGTSAEWRCLALRSLPTGYQLVSDVTILIRITCSPLHNPELPNKRRKSPRHSSETGHLCATRISSALDCVFWPVGTVRTGLPTRPVSDAAPRAVGSIMGERQGRCALSATPPLLVFVDQLQPEPSSVFNRQLGWIVIEDSRELLFVPTTRHREPCEELLGWRGAVGQPLARELDDRCIESVYDSDSLHYRR